MRKLILATASLAALAVAAPAFAQDGPPNPDSDTTFSGPRAGIILGYDRMQPGQVPNSSIDDRNSADGLTYGGDVGYDIRSGNLVFGAEGEVTGSTSKVTNNPSAAGALGYGRVKAGRDLYAGARVGYVVAPRTMIYAKGGYTNQRLDLVASDGTTETGQHFNLDGWRAGAGVEQSLAAQLELARGRPETALGMRGGALPAVDLGIAALVDHRPDLGLRVEAVADLQPRG
jgi:outer membrane immunogenic protein